MGALSLCQTIRYLQRHGQRGNFKFNTKLLHPFWFCKFLRQKTLKGICKPVGGVFHSWGCMMLQKHFMRLRGVFCKNMTIAEGLHQVKRKGAAPQHQDGGHTSTACVHILTQNTIGQRPKKGVFSLFALCSIEKWNTNGIPIYKKLLHLLKSKNQAFTHPHFLHYLHTKQKIFAMWVNGCCTPHPPGRPICYIIYHFKLKLLTCALNAF